MALPSDWLESPTSIRIILVEAKAYNLLTSTEDTFYFSSGGYITSDGLTSFDPIIVGSLTLTESLSANSTTAMSFGDIELNNPNGEIDSYIDSSKYIWVNRSIKVYLGDPLYTCADIAQVRSDFILVFDGLIKDIDSRTISTLNIKVRDKLERLNSAISEDKIGTYGTWAGGQQNKDTLKPLIFGEVHNIEPILIDPSQLEYMFNLGSSESIIEVRDNGVPITITPNIANGKFKLAASSFGTITLSAQGVKNAINLSTGSTTSTYSNNIAQIIALIVTQYGKSTTRLASSELDLTNLSAFASANTQAIGIYVTDRQNVLNVCKQILESISAQLFITRQGKLQLLQYGIPTSDTSITITPDDIIKNTFSLSNKLDIIGSVKLGYCKNWTIQTTINSAIPEEHKNLYALEWLTSTKINSTAITNYRLEGDAVQQDTLLLTQTSTDTEAQRLVDFYSQQRCVYKFTGTSRLFALKLGQPVTLTYPRYNLYNSGSGRIGQVVSLSPDWLKDRVEVEVLI